MACVQDVLNELSDTFEYVKLRPDSTHGRRMVESVASKIANVPGWTTAMSNAVTKRMLFLGFPADLAEVVTGATDGRLAEVHSGDHQMSSPNATKGQTLHSMHNYLTAADWAIIENPMSTPAQRDKQIALRLASLNVKRPSEDGTVKWAITNSVIVEKNLYGGWPSYRSPYTRVAALAEFVSLMIPNHILFSSRAFPSCT
jgi:hypothetical protein